MTSEQELVIIKKSRTDPGQFTPLYEKYYRMIYSYAFKKLAGDERAADITADTFFKAMTRIYQFKPGYSFSAWLYKIALNEIRMHFRKMKKENYLFRTEAIVESLHLPESPGRGDGFEQVEKCLLSLGEKDLILLELRFYQDLKFREIAEVLGIGEEGAKKKMQRLLNKLQKQLKEVVWE